MKREVFVLVLVLLFMSSLAFAESIELEFPWLSEDMPKVTMSYPDGWYIKTNEEMNKEASEQQRVSKAAKFAIAHYFFTMLFSKNQDFRIETSEGKLLDNTIIYLWVRKKSENMPSVTPMQMLEGNMKPFLFTDIKKEVVEKPSIVKIKGREVAKYIYDEHDKYRSILYCFQDNEFNDYQLTGKSNVEQFEKYLPIFENVMNSIEIK